MEPELGLREVSNTDRASVASKDVPIVASHILPRGNSLWDLPVELVCVELWPIRDRRCYCVPLSALPFSFTDGEPEVQTGAATCFGLTAEKPGMGGSVCWLLGTPLTL